MRKIHNENTYVRLGISVLNQWRPWYRLSQVDKDNRHTGLKRYFRPA
ncbi:MAG: hypothetical protein ABII09_08910 [Planctomycetota bacterium]